MLPLWLALASAAPPSALQGFTRLHADPVMLHIEPHTPRLPVRLASLVLANGHTVRATVWVEGQAIGEVGPQASGVIDDVVAGAYTVSWHLPGGIVRTEQIRAVAPEDADVR